ncbi:hypothetical protein AB1Y20_015025 [Prymnesium parvum]|uniref:Sfi1 spindle body domain-containing protein n=1 Tax=Prymnesium parvum TaxID=97485 RepID=A0AB34JZJ8_PRYPA
MPPSPTRPPFPLPHSSPTPHPSHRAASPRHATHPTRRPLYPTARRRGRLPPSVAHLAPWWERTIAAAATAWAARLHAARAAARRHLAAWAEAIARRQSARFWQWHAARQHHLLACRRATRRRAASLRRLAAAAADRSDSRTTRLLALAHHRLAATRRAWRALRRLRWLAPSRALHALPTLRGWQPEVRGWRAWRDAFRRAELTSAASFGAGGRKEAALLAALHARRAALLRGMCAWVWRVRAAAAARRREERARAPAALRRAVRAWVRRLPRLAAAEARRARVRLLVGRRRREGFGAALASLRLAAERERREGRAAAWRRRVHTRRAWRRWRRHTARERRLLSLLKPSVSIRPILCGVREQRMFDALRRGFGKWFSRWRRGRLDAIAEARAARRWEWRQIGRAQVAGALLLPVGCLPDALSTRRVRSVRADRSAGVGGVGADATAVNAGARLADAAAQAVWVGPDGAALPRVGGVRRDDGLGAAASAQGATGRRGARQTGRHER